MKVSVKDFPISMEIKNAGLELGIHSPDGSVFKGDLVIARSGLIWCKGRTKPANGKKISWEEFIKWAEGAK